jgi:Flp pilus assembly protein TadG
MHRPPTAGQSTRQRGQILVLFVLLLTAMVAMVGLVLDGGDTFAQRRDQQNGADLAAVAGANAYMNASGTVAAKTAAAQSAALAAATGNGYEPGTLGTTVTVNVSLLSTGARVKVDVAKPHANNFARIVGMNTWDVGVTATAEAGTIDTAIGSAPWTMSIKAFKDGAPLFTSKNPQDFGEGNGDYPISAIDSSWTDFNGNNNVNSSEVSNIISGSAVVISTFGFGQYLGQHNEGFHATLFGDVNQYLAGEDVPVPIVGPGDPDCAAPGQAHQDGCFYGWAMFHVISARGGDDRVIRGYFLENFRAFPLTVGECTPEQQAAGTCGVITTSPLGGYVVRLTD